MFGGGRGCRERGRKKTPIFLTNLVDVIASNVVLGVKFCMIVKIQ
jgi:hypothetical protein